MMKRMCESVSSTCGIPKRYFGFPHKNAHGRSVGKGPLVSIISPLEPEGQNGNSYLLGRAICNNSPEHRHGYVICFGGPSPPQKTKKHKHNNNMVVSPLLARINHKRRGTLKQKSGAHMDPKRDNIKPNHQTETNLSSRF